MLGERKKMNVLQGIDPLQMVRKGLTPQVTPKQNSNSVGSSATTSGKSTWADMAEQEESAKKRSEVRIREGVTWSRTVGRMTGEEEIDQTWEVNTSLTVCLGHCYPLFHYYVTTKFNNTIHFK